MFYISLQIAAVPSRPFCILMLPLDIIIGTLAVRAGTSQTGKQVKVHNIKQVKVHQAKQVTNGKSITPIMLSEDSTKSKPEMTKVSQDKVRAEISHLLTEKAAIGICEVVSKGKVKN